MDRNPRPTYLSQLTLAGIVADYDFSERCLPYREFGGGREAIQTTSSLDIANFDHLPAIGTRRLSLPEQILEYCYNHHLESSQSLNTSESRTPCPL